MPYWVEDADGKGNGQWVEDHDDEWVRVYPIILARNARTWRFIRRYYIVRNRLGGREKMDAEQFRSDLLAWRGRTTDMRSALARLVKELRRGLSG